MKHIGILAAVTLSTCAALSLGSGCGGGSTGSGGGSSSSSHSTSVTTSSSSTTTSSSTSTSTSSTSGSGGSMHPAPPTIGTQFDRMGRPAINTALNHSFDNTAAAGTAKDAYNQDSDPTMWQAKYTAEFMKNLAIIDSLDATCGNQLLYTKPASATSYQTLAGALADDKLYLNTGNTTCKVFLGVEVNAVGILANTDCGGRTLTENTIDTIYSAAAIGMFSGVSNGIMADADAASQTAAFPYLSAPH